MSNKFYLRNKPVPFEEDFFHELKGHRNICKEDLPPWTQENVKQDKASRRAASRVLNAFLNTGKGGTLYLGVLDDGIVMGLKLTSYQKDHVVGSVHDLMNRYNPPVKKNRYKVSFTPVYDSPEEADHVKQADREFEDPTLKLRDHEFRTSQYCWCDKDNVMQFNAGIMHQEYVIEIKIKEWDGDDPLNAGDGCSLILNMHQIHEDEEGKSYFRRQASLVQYTMTELASLSRYEVHDHCQQKINRLKREIARLEQMTETAHEDDSGTDEVMDV